MLLRGRTRLLMLALIALLVLSLSNVMGAQAQGDSDRLRISLESRRPLDIVKQLRDLDVIPAGGKIGLQLGRSAMNAIKDGWWYFGIGRGTELRDYVLHFELRPRNVGGDANGCGIAFRIKGDDNYSRLLLTIDRRIVLQQVDGGEAIVDVDQSVDDLEGVDATDYEFKSGVLNIVTIVAVDEQLIVFLNGLEVLREESAKSLRGRFALTLFNEEGNRDNTFCVYSNIFAWDLS